MTCNKCAQTNNMPSPIGESVVCCPGRCCDRCKEQSAFIEMCIHYDILTLALNRLERQCTSWPKIPTGAEFIRHKHSNSSSGGSSGLASLCRNGSHLLLKFALSISRVMYCAGRNCSPSGQLLTFVRSQQPTKRSNLLLKRINQPLHKFFANTVHSFQPNCNLQLLDAFRAECKMHRKLAPKLRPRWPPNSKPSLTALRRRSPPPLMQRSCCFAQRPAAECHFKAPPRAVAEIVYCRPRLVNTSNPFRCWPRWSFARIIGKIELIFSTNSNGLM